MINWNSILSKAKSCMNKESKQKEVNKYIVNVVLGKVKLAGGAASGGSSHPIEDAGRKFIEVLRSEINSLAMPEGSDEAIFGKLGPTAVSALSDLTIGEIKARSDGTFVVPVKFSGNLRRESLDPKRYPEGVSNIAALLNAGYGGIRGLHAVRGVWKGHGDEPRYSLTYRDGAHFVQNSIEVFMRDYAKEYGVIRIEPSDEYIVDNS